MGSNPMQKKMRNSVLLGLTIGLIIGLILCAVVYMMLTNGNTSSTLSGGEKVSVAVLNKGIKSGATISQADITVKLINKENVPADATTQVIGGIAKIDLASGTVVSNSMITTTGTNITKDLREQEYNMLTLPTKLSAGDYIDIRLQLPNGGDYIVISKKQVEKCNTSTVWIKMNEEEILTMSNAIVEYYIMAGSKLYATKYTDPGTQEAAVPTYCPSAEVISLISGNPNITSQIVDGQGRYSERLKSIRSNIINKELNNYSDNRLQNIEENIQSEIKALKESREAYFGALNSAGY